MVTIEKNFLTDLTQMRKSGDFDRLRNTLNSEIAALISNHRDNVIEALESSGVHIPSNVGNGELVRVVVKELGQNEQFRKGISFLIADRNDLIPEIKSNNDAATSGGKSSGFVTGIIGSVTGAVGDIFSYKAAKENTKAQEEANRTAILQLLSKQNSNKNTGLYVGLGVLSLALIIGVIIYTKKS